MTLLNFTLLRKQVRFLFEKKLLVIKDKCKK